MPKKLFSEAEICEIIDEFNSRNSAEKNLSLQELAVWAKTNFQLANIPHTSTISRILKKEAQEGTEGGH